MLKNRLDCPVLLKPNFKDNSTNTNQESQIIINNPKPIVLKFKNLFLRISHLETKLEEYNKI